MNLLREVEVTQVWAPADVAPILADPVRHDLPCQWYDRIPVDRVLPLAETFTWHEYRITVHGHTRYAAAFELEVDGVRVLVTGDQQEGLGIPGQRRDVLDDRYGDLVDIEDFRRSAALYRRVAPGVIVTGHWQPRWVDPACLEMVTDAAEEFVELHQELLPLEDLDLGTDGVLARVAPYLSVVRAGRTARITVTMRNPTREDQKASVQPVLPRGRRVRPDVAVDVRIGDSHLGQHAEALVDVVDPVERVDDLCGADADREGA